MSDQLTGASEEFSGDVRLDGGHDPPVGLRGAEDVYVGTGAVDGALSVVDPEYVFTDCPVDWDAASPASEDVETSIAGADLEDGYVEDVGGDVVASDACDVFVEWNGATDLAVAGAEQVFRDDAAAPTLSADQYDLALSGWNHSRSVRDPRTGISVTGAKNEVTLTEATQDLTVYVTGWENEVRIEGRGVEATVYFVGRDNEVSVGPYVSTTTAAESGFDNAVRSDPLPPEAVVQTTKEEAFGEVTFGRRKVTWQEPAEGEEWCPNCGEQSDAIVVRKRRDAVFLLGTPIWTYDEGGKSYECEACCRHAVGGGVALSEQERKDVLR